MKLSMSMIHTLFYQVKEAYKGKWREAFSHPDRPLYMELGTGKGRFIAGMSEAYPDANFVGFEVQSVYLLCSSKDF